MAATKRPGQATRRVLELLRQYESRNITFVDPAGEWPIVWTRARGSQVQDADGRRYVDLTAAFGVANAGHANPRVVRAGQRQMAHLLHAMGDVHPHPLKAQLARELSRITFERWTRAQGKRGHVTGKCVFCNSGFEAVEAALKTAHLATGRREVIAFSGAYHGLGYGALNTTHRRLFRAPFESQLGRFGVFVDFPLAEGGSSDATLAHTEHVLRKQLKRGTAGAMIVEPIQGRGGIRVPPAGFLRLLRALCDEFGIVLVVDEIYTGFGRTGRWFACEHEDVVPDLICLGKALTGGFPMSVCVGRAELMDRAWPETQGEAIHTSTFLGHPVGCAMARAQIAELHRRHLPERSAELGDWAIHELQRRLQPLGARCQVRGRGLMIGIELRDARGKPAGEWAMRVVKAMLQRGFVLLPEGEQGEVISLTPPLTIAKAQLGKALRVLAELLCAEAT